ncbi:MAG: DUF3333 domain-containing protein, partial [Sphingomonas sp.]
MTDRAPTDWRTDAMRRRIARRYRSERRFRALGLGAIIMSAGFLAFLIVTMLAQGLGGFTETRLALPINFAAADLQVQPDQLRGNRADLALAGA